ncbi:hypothetical protein CFOL_v3_01104 [Cephalotus follicularis]|uniref:Uncharacterized protein n=1 Tax=Cephalotus follicularis TaxID=3775 RepID=A0A1Q3AP86_CEPFO|nr:hypothetical protein CFOL_v3_01104 [Cephalotus follicularis]
MDSVYTIRFVAILLALRPLTASCDFLSELSPLLSPVFDSVCKEVECGKGKCKPSQNSSFFFECECDPGWKQSVFHLDGHLTFLPCIVPNCTLNYACAAAAAPPQEKTTKTKESIFDPCHWTDCGGGSCNKTSSFTYSCECAEGYYNLLNITAFPCFKECSIGMDCSNLGISTSNKSTSSTPGLASQAGSNLQGKHLWLIMMMISIAMVHSLIGDRLIVYI